MRTLRIFISSPNDVAEERDKARQVVESLGRTYAGLAELEVVMWEDLALSVDRSAQQSIEAVLSKDHGVDIAVFILWSRLGSPLSVQATPKPGGGHYRSGTEHEFELMLAARERSPDKRPHLLAYWRQDEKNFIEGLKHQSPERYRELLEQRELVREFIDERFMDEQGRNIRGVHMFAEPVAFAQRLHSHLRQVIDELLALEGGSPRWSEAPYRGLEAFDIEHAPIFHGRDEETQGLLDRLRERGEEPGESAFAVIVGASGSGKSSLARAGVAATLRERSFDERVREWRSAVLLPALAGEDLFGGLVQHLIDVLPELGEGSGGASAADLADEMASNPGGAVKLVIAPAFARASEAVGGALKLLLVIDQMEELWTDRRIGAEDRERFLEALEALSCSGHIAVLATLRSDFYPQAQQSEVFLRMKGERGHFDLVAPGTHALQRLIVEPARLAGLSFERDDKSGRSLDQQILEDALGDPGALPLLQYALAELYQRRDEGERTLRFAAYEAMGGVEGALGRRAEEVFGALGKESQAALDDILPLLVTVDTGGEQSAVRRRAPLALLRSTEAGAELVDALVEARFLVTDQSEGEAVAALAHEALLKRWPRLQEWIQQNRDLLRLRALVEQAEKRWGESNRNPSLLLVAGLPIEEGRQLIREGDRLLSPETRDYIEASIAHHEQRQRRRTRARRLVTAGLATLTVLALVGGAIARKQQRLAAVEKQRAEEARADAEELVGFMLNDLRSKLADVGRLELMEGVETAVREYYEAAPTGAQDNERAEAQRAQGLLASAETLRKQGRLDEAQAVTDEAVSVLRFVFDADRQQIELIEKLGAALQVQAMLLENRGRLEQSYEILEEGSDILTGLARYEMSIEGLIALSKVRQHLSRMEIARNGATEKTHSHVLDALRVALVAHERAPAHEGVQANLVRSVLNAEEIGTDTTSLWSDFENPGSFSELEQAMIAEQPRNYDRKAILLEFISTYDGVAYDRIRTKLDRGLELALELTQHDPSNLYWQRLAADLDVHIGLHLHSAGFPDRCLAHLAAAERRYRAILASGGGGFEVEVSLGDLLSLMGLEFQIVKDTAAALEYQTAAVELLERLHEQDPDHVVVINELAYAKLRLSGIMEGDDEERLEVLKNAFQLAETAYARAPDYGFNEEGLYYTASSLAGRYLTRRELDLASKYNDVALEVAHTLSKSNVLIRRGEICAAGGDHDDAAQAYREAAENWLLHLPKYRPLGGHATSAGTLANAVRGIIDHAQPLTSADNEALATYFQSMYASLAKTDPGTHNVSGGVMAVSGLHFLIAQRALDAGDNERFRDHLQKGADLLLAWSLKAAQSRHRLAFVVRLADDLRNREQQYIRGGGSTAITPEIAGSILANWRLLDADALAAEDAQAWAAAHRLPFLACRGRGILALEAGENEEAAQWFANAAQFLRDGWAAGSDAEQAPAALVSALLDFAKYHTDTLDDLETGETLWREALEWREALFERADEEDRPWVRRALALDHQGLGERLNKDGRKEDSLQAHRSAAEICRELHRTDPSMLDSLLVFSHKSLADRQRELDSLEDAVATYKVLLEIIDAAQGDTGQEWEPNVRGALAAATENLGQTLERLQRHGEVETAYRRSLEWWQTPGVTAWPKIPGVVMATRVKVRLANLYGRTGRGDDPQRKQWIEESYATLQPLAEAGELPDPLKWVHESAHKQVAAVGESR